MEVGGAEMVAPVEGPGSLPLPLGMSVPTIARRALAARTSHALRTRPFSPSSSRTWWGMQRTPHAHA